MSDKKKGRIPRSPVFNPFQTYTYGTYVGTANDAHFDPYAGAEAPAAPTESKQQMETVVRVVVAVG